jgi:hypothetical protein
MRQLGYISLERPRLPLHPGCLRVARPRVHQPAGSSHDQGSLVRRCVCFSSRSSLPLRSNYQELARCYTGKIATWVSPPLASGLSPGSTFGSGQNRWGRRCRDAADPGVDNRAARHLERARLPMRPPFDREAKIKSKLPNHAYDPTFSIATRKEKVMNNFIEAEPTEGGGGK